jgi:hypothetical protein
VVGDGRPSATLAACGGERTPSQVRPKSRWRRRRAGEKIFKDESLSVGTNVLRDLPLGSHCTTNNPDDIVPAGGHLTTAGFALRLPYGI